MKITITNHLKKAVAVTALTVAPALALTSAAQAAPAYRAPLRNNTASAWNNNSRYKAPRANNRYVPTPRVQAPRYVLQNTQPRYDGYRNNGRFDSRYDTDRNRNRDNHNGNDTGKIIGAGIVGAILGAVLSR